MMNQADPIMQCRRTSTAFFVRPLITALFGKGYVGRLYKKLKLLAVAYQSPANELCRNFQKGIIIVYINKKIVSKKSMYRMEVRMLSVPVHIRHSPNDPDCEMPFQPSPPFRLTYTGSAYDAPSQSHMTKTWLSGPV